MSTYDDGAQHLPDLIDNRTWVYQPAFNAAEARAERAEAEVERLRAALHDIRKTIERQMENRRKGYTENWGTVYRAIDAALDGGDDEADGRDFIRYTPRLDGGEE